MTALSVVLPVRDGGDQLALALDSVLSQTFRDFELIVVDDCSTDATPDTLRRYAAGDDRIRVIRLDRNVGVAAALNRGIEHASAPLIARMDADDVSAPMRFERQVEVMAAEPEIGVLGTRTRFVDECGEPAAQAEWVQPSTHAEVAWHLLFGCPITHPSVVLRAEVLRSVGGYDTGFPNEDYELWTRLAFVTRLRNLDEVLLDYRMPAELHQRKLEAWAPHIERVGQRYVERLLGHPVSAELFHTLHLIRRHGDVPPAASEIDVSLSIDLLIALARALLSRGVVDEEGAGAVQRLLAHEVDRLAAAGAAPRLR